MKLLSAFHKQIDAVGSVQRVWFTSFVINVEFIETYLLPAILGMDTPKLRMDYEGMQQVLGERGIDVRVFCDKRFVDPDQNKRTAIPVHGVSPERLPANGAIAFTEDSLFHPKVIYLQGEKGSVVGTGSANLTVDGWGRNQEVFSFAPMVSRALAESVRSFFGPLFANVYEPFPEDFPVPSQVTDQTETFCHSLGGASFLDHLFDSGPRELAVWSPYFSRDISNYVKALQRFSDTPSLRVRLVPDRVEDQYLRAEWSQGLADLHEQGSLALYQSPAKRDDRSFMTHAKLWKTPDRLAIGSWNFTQPGSNLTPEGRAKSCNVEAGFIIKDDSEVADFVGGELPLSEALFASPEQMAQESLRVPEPPPFDLQVVFDWQVERFFISGVWVGKAAPCEYLQLQLPAISHFVDLKWQWDSDSAYIVLEELELPVSSTKALLIKHSYEVHHGSDRVTKGLIIEKRAVFRRAQQYEDLRGLLDALVLSGGAPPADDVAYRVREDDDGEALVDVLAADDEGAVPKRDIESADISYFRLFSACHHYAELLASCRDQKELEYWAFIRPGCLQELVEKTNRRIQAALSQSLFNWFLAMEVNQLCDAARVRCARLPGVGMGRSAERWEALSVPEPKLPESLSYEYRLWLADEYQRRSSNKETI